MSTASTTSISISQNTEKDQLIDVVRSFGIYRSVFGAAVVFNSIAFRLILGVTSNVSMSAVALVTAIEFSLNAIFEIPGGRIADRYGRIFVSLIGLLLIGGGLVAAFFAVLMAEHSTTLSQLLLVLDGLCLGFGKPLLSGSIEAFYQHQLADRSRHLGNESKDVVAKSFTMSTVYGKYLTTISICTSFAVIGGLYYTIGSEYALLVGSTLFIYLVWRVHADAERFGAKTFHPSEAVSPFRHCLKPFLRSGKARFGILLMSLFYVMNAAVSGYFVVSLGRVLKSDNNLLLIGTGLFMLGHTGIGWILKASLLPRLLEVLTERRFLFVTFFFYLILSVGFYYLVPILSDVELIAASFLFGAVSHLAATAVQNIAANTILSQFEDRDFATALSISNMPGCLWIGIFSAYVGRYLSGTPSIPVIAMIVAASSVIGIIVTALLTSRSDTVTSSSSEI